MKNRVITISCEFGSGGRTIGKQTAAVLNIPCYDRELVEKIARQSGLDPDYVESASEDAPGGPIVSAFSNRDFGPNNADYIWTIQYRIITELAEQGPCVIVGRCADYTLRDKADCLRVFVHADQEFRARRILKEYGERETPAVQRLRDKDKRRANNYEHYTGQKWGASQNYHLCLDSSVIGIDRCVDLIESLTREL